MSFIQIINFKTDRFDEIQAERTQWMEQAAGKRTAIDLHLGKNREEENSYSVIVEFPSYEEAMENSKLPETQAFAEKMTKLCTEPPTYINLDVLEEEAFLNAK